MKIEQDLSGRNIIFINSGGPKKRFTIERAKSLKATIILVNQKLDAGRKLVDFFIEADTYNHDEVVEKLKNFQKQNPKIHFHGAITFWEDDIPLLGRVCREFNLEGNSYKTSINTRNKYEMRKRLEETGLGDVKFHLVKSKKDLEKAIGKIGFPAVMKPAWGADSEFVILVKNVKEAENTFEYLVNNCNEQFNPIFKYNNGAFLFEEYLDGMEVSLECFSQYGIPHVIGINEKQPIKPPYFVEYGDIAPARIDEDKELGIIKLAESALIALGVENSLSHIEIKITSKGPRIVEIASRMGGDDIYSNVKHIWGVDMVEIGLRIACKRRANYTKKPDACCVVCRYFIPEFSGIITNISGFKEFKKNRNVIDIVINKNVGDAILVPPEGFENAGWAIVKGRTYQEADTLMNKVIKSVEINVTKFHKDSSLGKTKRKSALSAASITRNEIIRASKIAKIRSIDLNEIRKLKIGILTNSSIPLNDKETKSYTVGESIKTILEGMGYHIHLFDMNEMPLPIKKIQSANLDFMINLCETIYDSTFLKSHAAALLDMLQLPYTGSSPSTLALCLDKIKVKKLLDYHEIPTPEWDYVESMDETISSELRYPLIVKPANAENSFGISNNSVVTTEKQLKKQLEMIVEGFKRPALIEEYIEGDEYDVCVIGNEEDIEVLPLMRSIFNKIPKKYWHIYSSDLRNEKNNEILDYIRIEKPAKIPKKMDALISEMAMDVYNIFDCHDYAKVELRVDKNGNPFIIEINPNPSIEQDTFLPMAAKLAGYQYEDFIEEIIWMAVQRYKNKPPFYHLQ